MSAQPLDEEAIFKVACQIGSPQGRADYLRQVCGSDDALHDRVALLLQEHQEHPSFLESPPEAFVLTIDMPAELPAAEKIGTVIGPYKLLQQIGEGGMGVVYMAEQAAPVRRKVALKIIKPGMDTREVIARFEAERQALALMDHPNIARVFDGGATAAGRPYFVMELVRGVPITDYCDQNSLPVHERLELFITVCHAVQHAHQKGIIHRDIKPTNVLVTLHDDGPVPKVIDFGVAKAIDQQLTDKTLFTQFAQILGTPLYMSPEQAQMMGQDVDTRADIYSLGVLLYELLTGTTPFERGRLKQAALDEIRRVIREDEPPKPSLRISTLGMAATTVSTQRNSDPRRLIQIIRGDLDWIVMKALEKDRTRRYATASAFADDVERYLRDESVDACPPSATYRFRKFARRNRTALFTATCVFAALVTVAVSIGWIVRDRTVQTAAIDTEMRRAHDEAVALIELAKWPEALAIVQRAEQLFEAAGRHELPQPLQELKKDLAMAERLEHIFSRPKSETFFMGHEPDSAYAEAFVDAGIDVTELSVTEAAERLRARRIWREYARALDIWASMRQRAGNPKAPDWKQLLEIAEATDPDPWRNSLRKARRQSDIKTLTALAAAVEIPRYRPESLHLLGNALHDCGAQEQSMALLRQAQLQYPEDWWINNLMGWYSLTAVPPNYDDALRYYSAALSVRPLNVSILQAIVRALVGKKAYAEAVIVCSRGIELSPNDAEQWSRRGTVYGELGQLDKALADCSKAIELAPTDSQAWTSRGLVYQNQGRCNEALADYSKAIELAPTNSRAWSGRGVVYYRERRWDEALAEFSKAMELAPGESASWTNLGVTYAKLGKWNEALADCSKAIELAPAECSAWYNRCLVYEDQGRWNEALADYNTTISLNPSDWGRWDDRGTVYMKIGQPEKALADFTQSLALHSQASWVWRHRGMAYRELGHWDAALADCQKAFDLAPQSTLEINALAWLLAMCPDLKSRDPARAVGLATRATGLDPNNWALWNTLGAARYRAGAWNEAVEALNKSMDLHEGGNSLDWLFLAMAHWQLGDQVAARRWYDKAVEWMNQNQPLNEELQLVRAEAEVLLQ